jgi:hypothetical protein
MNLGIYLDSSVQTQISLKDFLQEQFPDYATFKDLILSITIAPHMTLTINDNLINYSLLKDSVVFYHKIEFILCEGAHIAYTTHLIPEDHNFTRAPGDMATLYKELSFKFTGPHAQADIKCAYVGTGEHVVKFKTVQDHQCPQTKSSLGVFSVLDDSAHFTCASVIKVAPNAHHTQANQVNKNILLCPTAHAISVPQLEIEADDVSCKHGATVSTFDEEQMFYLQSRGFDHPQAQNLLIEAFLI